MGSAESVQERTPEFVASDVLERVANLERKRDAVDQPGHTISYNNLFIAISWKLKYDSIKLNAAGVHLDLTSIALVPRDASFSNLVDVLKGVRLWRTLDEESSLGYSDDDDDDDVDYRTVCAKGVVVQLETPKQRHSGACGHHALYNAVCVLRGRPMDVAEMYGRMLQSIRLLSSRYPKTDFSTGILDDAHLKVVAMEVYGLNKVHISPTGEAVARYEDGAVHLIGAVSHWAACVCLNNKVYYLDSHNKPLYSEQGELAVSIRAVEDHREVFSHRLRINRPDLTEAPKRIIDSLYDEGIPEYHKGELKPELYWKHRPFSTRAELIVRELRCSRAYVEFLANVSPVDNDAKLPTVPSRPAENLSSHRVRVDYTSELDFLYVREDAPLENIDFSSQPTLENRKKPPLAEHPLDAFDRQRVIPGWDQRKIEGQRCLVVGTGGIGMNVALNLVRLGVDFVTMVDFDVYEPSNLTRQCLGSVCDVGDSKLNAAMRNIRHHNLRSEIRALECDVVSNFRDLLDDVRSSRYSVIFNCVDAGTSVDFALNSLSKRLGVPYVIGQSFGWKYMTEIYDGCNVCQFCDASSPFESIDPKLDLKYPEAIELYQKSPDSYDRACLDSVSVDNILSVTNLKHLPYPPKPQTRWIGSWVGPCLGAATTMVSQWANLLTGPTHRNPPCVMLVNLDDGMTSEESMFYELAALGASADDVEDRRRVCDESLWDKCVACVKDSRPTRWLMPVKGTAMDIAQIRFSAPGVGVEERLAVSKFANVPALNPVVEKNVRYSTPKLTFPLNVPFIQTDFAGARAHPSSVRAYKSGRRSAIVPNNSGGWYRLKGCGDDLLGFHVSTDQGMRGCMFDNTAARAMAMTLRIKQLDLNVANEPLGWFAYADPPEARCVVFETKGDSRLADHLLRGLCLLGNSEDLEGGFNIRETSTAMQVETGGKCSDFSHAHPACAVAAAVGLRAGKFLRALHDARISWGTFPDESGIHCNAHANNFVCDDEGQLWALDFDMAYNEEDFVGVDTEKFPFFPPNFGEILAFEAVQGMRASLGGSDFASTGVAGGGGGGGGARANSFTNAVLDTAVFFFDKGYAGEDVAAPETDVRTVRQALKATADVVT